MGSKQAGAEWAWQQLGCPLVVMHAIQRREGGATLDVVEANALTMVIDEAVQAALRREQAIIDHAHVDRH